MYSIQLLHRKFDISVCGFFNVDNTLLYTVLLIAAADDMYRVSSELFHLSDYRVN